MTHVKVVQTEFVHIRALCEDMREREREGFTKLGWVPERKITQEVAQSVVCFTGLIDDRVVVMWGLRAANFLADEAYVWIICAEEIYKHPYIFLRHSREQLDYLRRYFKCIHGLVLDSFNSSVRWLEWLGFEIGPSINGVRTFTIGGAPTTSGLESHQETDGRTGFTVC